MRRTAALLLGAGDAAALVLLRPDVVRLAGHLGTLHSRLAAAPDAVLGELAAALTWLAAAWLALGLLAALGTTLPGTVGRVADRASRALLPATLRGLVAGSAGLGVLLAPAASLAGPPPPSTGTSLPAPAWPVSIGPAVPTTPASPPGPSPAAGPATPAGPSPHVPPPVWPAQRPAPPPASTVRVQPGDSLWLIAARRLGPDATPTQIADEWPRWYAANRAAIGPDPDVIHSGQLFTAPEPSEEAAT